MSELTRWCYKQRAVLFIFISIFASYRERFGRVKAVVRESNWTNQTRGGDNNIKRKDWSRKSYGICEKSLWKSGNFIGALFVQVWIFKERCHEIYQRSLEVGTSASPHVRESGFRNPGIFCLWNPESRALESRNPTRDWNPESNLFIKRSTPD